MVYECVSIGSLAPPLFHVCVFLDMSEERQGMGQLRTVRKDGEGRYAMPMTRKKVVLLYDGR